MKLCVKCQTEFELDRFHKNRLTRDGHSSYCKSCAREKVREWTKKNPGKRRELASAYASKHKAELEKRRKERASANPEHTKELRRKHARKCRLKGRGLTDESLMAKLENQGFVCALCETGIDLKTAAIDHCHETGKTRDLLCRRCNMSLGHLESNAFYVRAFAYIERHRSAG